MLTLWSIIKKRWGQISLVFARYLELKYFKDALCNRTNTPEGQNWPKLEPKTTSESKFKKKNKNFQTETLLWGEAPVPPELRLEPGWRFLRLLLQPGPMILDQRVSWWHQTHAVVSIDSVHRWTTIILSCNTNFVLIWTEKFHSLRMFLPCELVQLVLVTVCGSATLVRFVLCTLPRRFCFHVFQGAWVTALVDTSCCERRCIHHFPFCIP